VPGQELAGNASPVLPVLQAEDGSFVGNSGFNMVAFDQAGNVRWIVPNEYPLIATDDGGVIGQSGITYDQNGNATGQAATLPIYSWTGNAYQQQGSVEQISSDLLSVLYDLSSSFWPILGGNYSGNETAYALVRAFQDNVVDPDVIVTNPSQSDPNQQIITGVLNKILQALSPGSSYGSCSAWLTGASTTTVSQYISLALLVPPRYGHGVFNNVRTAAISGITNEDGTPTGVPTNYVFTVNDQSVFFKANLGDKNFTVGPRQYPGNTLKAQLTILIHELAHQMNSAGGAAGFKDDAGKPEIGRANDKLVDDNCRTLIEGLR
jgi:hypothetical protein